MIVTCPGCATRYHVDPASLGAAGRTVRCASCGHRWLARPPLDAPRVVDLGPRPAAAVAARSVAQVETARRRGSPGLIGWLAAVLVVLVLASVVIGRNEIVAGFPASASIYQKLGLPVTVQLGLQFENVTSKRLDERGISILVVEGEVVNLSDQRRAVPPIRLTLLDDAGRQLQHELFEVERPELAVGGRTSFSGRVVSPAEQARNFSIAFDLDN
jgi:predicted Zn finger-like uncharacterized protein